MLAAMRNLSNIHSPCRDGYNYKYFRADLIRGTQVSYKPLSFSAISYSYITWVT